MTRAPLPALSAEQRAEAAARGVAARQLRADVRVGLRDGQFRIGEVLADAQGDDERGRMLARMRVVDLVSSFRGYGPVRAADLMEGIGIAANRRLGGLGTHQIQALVEALDRDPAASESDSAGPDGATG